MENEFHEMDDLQIHTGQEEDPKEDDDQEETSFINKSSEITRVSNLGDEESESVKRLFNNVESLRELAQKRNMESIRRKAKRIEKIIRLRKKEDRLTKQENIELKEIADNPEKSKQSESIKERYMKSVRREEKKRLELMRIQKKLDELAEQEEDPKEDDDQEETSFINKSSDPTNKTDPENKKHTRVDYIDRDLSHRVAIRNILINFLDLEPQCGDPKFVDYLIDINVLGNDFGLVVTSMSDERITLLRRTIRDVYDEWVEKERNKTLKKAGIATAIGLSLIALITGLSVGLTRKGANMVHQAKKWEKLTPAIRKKVIPWIELEKATGKVVIFTGEHLVIIITLVGIFLYEK